MNVSRVGISEDGFLIEFGHMEEKSDLFEVTVLTRVHIPADNLGDLVAKLYRGGQLYQKKFGKNLGFKELDSENDDWVE